MTDTCRVSNFLPSASHRPQDECDKELRSLEKKFTETCERHETNQKICRTEAKSTIEHMSLHDWQDHLASTVLKEGKKPVFWAGFWPGGEKGIDTRKALADFISSVNGFQLADTEWGQAAESEGANNLENCPWDRKKNWWTAASIKMAEAMALHDVQHITIALHKTLHGNFSFYRTVLYRAELPHMGVQIWRKSSWNPQFEVRSIAVEGAPPHESGCALASEVKYQLELHARRTVTVWCRNCTTLQACGDKQEVEKKRVKAKCIEGNCRNGQGTYTWANGDTYQGEWKNGKMDGQGTHTDADGANYQGEWKNDLKEGQGTYTWANGDTYQGQYKNGLQDGQGTYTFANGDTYHGDWKKDLQDGQGTTTFANGDKYQGEYKNGLRQGQGTWTSTNGDTYQGDWKKELQDGQGTYTWADGDKYQGEWKNGLKDGRGTFTFANGDKYEVWYKEDHGHMTKKVR